MSALSLLSRSPQPHSDFEALLVRMRGRLYPETIPVLASCWLKTVYLAGHERRWWKELNELLEQALREPQLDATSQGCLNDIQTWINQSGILTGKLPAVLPPRREPHRANLRSDRLAPYITRLLNEWLAAEVAALLVNETEASLLPEEGVPALATGRALERLLVRERLSPETLEMLLQPGILSPKFVYPADAEMLVDVVLSLLGRTWAPALPVMPATFLVAPADTPLPPDYAELVRRASLVERESGEEIHVPLPAEHALKILNGDPVRIASLILTMDGRCWESESLQSGEQHWVVYKPGARLQIDYTADHARLALPWPAAEMHWNGPVRLQDPIEIFGREWQTSSWETNGRQTRLNLVFFRVLPIAEIEPAAETALRRSRPASVDMAWAALENALAASFFQESTNPIEQLRRGDFIPVARAICGLMEAVKHGRLLKREAIETQLRAIRYLQSEVSLEYGRVPWRILPAPVREPFLKLRLDAALLDLLNEVFDGLPESISRTKSPGAPSQAA